MAVEMEASVWRSLYCWVTRGPRVPAGAQAFSYVGADAVGAAGLHHLVGESRSPSSTWCCGHGRTSASLSWPSECGADLHDRLVAEPRRQPACCGTLRHPCPPPRRCRLHPPWETVRAVSMHRRTLPSSKAVQLSDTTEGAVVSVPVMSETKIDVLLAHPVEVDLPNGPTAVVAVRISADDPDELVKDVPGAPGRRPSERLRYATAAAVAAPEPSVSPANDRRARRHGRRTLRQPADAGAYGVEPAPDADTSLRPLPYLSAPPSAHSRRPQP
jgi:hypothetical protein